MRELVWAIVILLGLFFVLCLTGSVRAQVNSNKFFPPPEYDHDYQGDLTIKMADTIEELRILCATGAQSNPNLLACSQHNETSCLIIMVRDEVMRQRGFSTGLLLQHERGHCNGWPGDHGGGIALKAGQYWVGQYVRTQLPRSWETEAQQIRNQKMCLPQGYSAGSLGSSPKR